MASVCFTRIAYTRGPYHSSQSETCEKLHMTIGMLNLEYVFKSVCDSKKRSCFILIFTCTQVMRHQKNIYKTNLNFIDFKWYITDEILISVVGSCARQVQPVLLRHPQFGITQIAWRPIDSAPFEFRKRGACSGSLLPTARFMYVEQRRPIIPESDPIYYMVVVCLKSLQVHEGLS